LNNEDAIELGYEAACLKNVSSPLVMLVCPHKVVQFEC